MKTTMKSMLALMAGAMVLAACSSDGEFENINEQQTSALKPMTFTASMEGHNGGTRATIDGSHYATDKLYDVKWVADDKISVFDGSDKNNGNQEFRLDTGGGTTTGTFIGDAAEKAGVYYALYPYVASSFESKDVTLEDAKAAAPEHEREIERMWKDLIEEGEEGEEMVIEQMTEFGISPEHQAIILAYLKGEKVEMKSGPQRNNTSNQFENVVLPAEQTVAEGQCIDPKAMLMIAMSTDASTLQFKNVCAYVKVTPKFDCAAIALRSKGSESLAGTITVDYNEGAPTATVTANGTNEVLLTGTIKSGNDYYIAVLPGSLASGFTIEFLDKDMANYYARSTSKTLVLTRNNVTNLGSFATSGAWSIKTATSGTDAEGHGWELVSLNPMLKLATTSAGNHNGTTMDLNQELRDFGWGEDWVLPSRADVEPLFNAKAISWSGTSQNWTVTFTRLGILKYMGDFTTTVKNNRFLLSDAYDESRQYTCSPEGIRFSYINEGQYSAYEMLCKYVGE